MGAAGERLAVSGSFGCGLRTSLVWRPRSMLGQECSLDRFLDPSQTTCVKATAHLVIAFPQAQWPAETAHCFQDGRGDG
jgi:hypothetical protein